MSKRRIWFQVATFCEPVSIRLLCKFRLSVISAWPMSECGPVSVIQCSPRLRFRKEEAGCICASILCSRYQVSSPIFPLWFNHRLGFFLSEPFLWIAPSSSSGNSRGGGGPFVSVDAFFGCLLPPKLGYERWMSGTDFELISRLVPRERSKPMLKHPSHCTL